MSKLKLYCLKDTVVGNFMNPFVMHNDKEAERAFKMAVNSNQKTHVVENYKDISLYCLGEYDDVTGAISSDIYFVQAGSNVKEVQHQYFNIPVESSNDAGGTANE